MSTDPNVVYIYILSDPDTGRIRYVGSTVNPDGRLQGHISAPTSPRMAEWIAGLAERGAVPAMRVVDSTAPETRDVIERRWIRRVGRRVQLLNGTWTGTRPSPRKIGAESHDLSYMRVTARLEPGAVAAFEALSEADGATMTTVINRALLDIARVRGLVEAMGAIPAGDISARVAALEAWRKEQEQGR